VAALRRAEVGLVCRYLSHDTTGKNLTRAEAERLSAAGIWLVVVWESAAGRARSGRGGGVADARAADAQARACGMPRDRPIYFAVDADATGGEQTRISACLDGVGVDHDHGMTEDYGQWRVGVRPGDPGRLS
jgi:hypothetical protein